MRVYHERLRVPVSWWVLGLGSALMLGAGFLAGFDWEPALAVYAAITVPLAAFLVGWGWLRIEVNGGELRVGQARLPLAQAGPVTTLDEDQTRALRGPRSDPAAFLLARPYLPRAVYIPVEDPAGLTPYWLIGTRRPAELAAAIDAARPAARAGGAPVG
ncbi:MAG: DUF3093 domain-containing protein [Streptosporangiaceae bacterium]